jgi:hypothetical protein
VHIFARKLVNAQRQVEIALDSCLFFYDVTDDMFDMIICIEQVLGRRLVMCCDLRVLLDNYISTKN